MGVVLNVIGSFAESMCSTSRLLINEENHLPIPSIERDSYQEEWTLQCVNCGHYAPNIPGVRYCPNCGQSGLVHEN